MSIEPYNSNIIIHVLLLLEITSKIVICILFMICPVVWCSQLFLKHRLYFLHVVAGHDVYETGGCGSVVHHTGTTAGVSGSLQGGREVRTQQSGNLSKI